MATVPTPTIEMYARHLDQAIVELKALRTKLKTAHGVPQTFTVSKETEALTNFSHTYQARLTASQALGTPEEAHEALDQDLIRLLHMLTAMKDEIAALRPTTENELDKQRAAERYNQRALVLEHFISNTEAVFSPPVTDSEAKSTMAPASASLTGKSSQELLRMVTRAVPVEEAIDQELTSFLYVLLRDAHIEESIRSIVPPQSMIVTDDELRSAASSQEFRDYVGAYFSTLLSQVLKGEEVLAFDDTFRSAYFAVVSYLLRYYRSSAQQAPEQVSVQPSAVSSTTTPPAPPTMLELAKESQQGTPPVTKTGDGRRKTVGDEPQTKRVQGTGLS